jgi:hypothetical protein
MYKKNKSFSYDCFEFDLIQVGVGGTGGYVVQRLAKMLSVLSDLGNPFSYMLIDGDQVEEKNLCRQPFIPADLNQPKAAVLADRYGSNYNLPITAYSSYLDKPDDLIKLFHQYHLSAAYLPILIGCVDNNATRQLMHQVFQKIPTIIYIDAGIDAINPAEDKKTQREMGYSGQVVCGFRFHDTELLPPVGAIYGDILKDQDTRLPTEACGQTIVNHPQRMQTNEFAALILTGYLNNILFDLQIVSHYTNFNARTGLSRPTYFSHKLYNRATELNLTCSA